MGKRLLIFVTILGLVLACSKDDGPGSNSQKSSAKEISGFSFRAADNGVLENDVIGTIDQRAKTINLFVPSATDVSALVPEIVISEKAVVDPQGADDFNMALSYTVTAEDGTKVTYQITVIIAASSAKQILSFKFLNIEVDGVQVDINAEIDVDNKIITATMPVGTDITTLEPSLEISPEASIDKEGVQDFSTPLNYIITAGDGTSDKYTVVISIKLSQKEILLRISEVNPDNTLGWREDKNLNDFEGVELDDNGNIRKMVLGSYNLKTLPPEIGQLSELRELILTNNELMALPKEIGQLAALETINLHNNNFEVLPSEIGQLSGLHSLSVTGNMLQILPVKIGELSNLQTLSLGGNDLKSLPKEIGQLLNLQTLGLSSNNLESIPQEIGMLAGLLELNLERNSLSALPLEIEQLSNLTNLDLSRNNIESLPSEIGQLSDLTTLNLWGNNLESLPSEIGQLSNLTNLDLKRNNLVSLPSEIEQLSNLRVLNLSENNLESLPLEIGQLSNLTNLDLSRNNLESLPSEIGQLADLVILSLSNNSLVAIPMEIGRMTHLRFLVLSDNNLSDIPKTLSNLKNLTNLSLDGNIDIEVLHNDICDMDLAKGGVVDIDIIPSDEVECVGDEIGG